MIKILAWLLVFIFTLPFVLQTYVLTPFLGKKRAIRIVGRQLTSASVLAAKLIVPRINSKLDFSIFKERIKRNFLFFEKLLCLRIENETQDKIEFKFRFCPVTEMLKMLGLPELCKYSCAGDWKVAKENKEYWVFTRKQTIGTGGLYCNHTYSRKQ
ncbi:MAG: L-2-amino-thiazoline-4-carboxylic acid hydrolase [Syntrophaceae bacterium]|nr:L-2-amino-thiazoline-4-carboxylic acid hydrolase [Syntrophaceae bacterium]NTW76826.1 L-2-amino-thiazoline-4-carboxylic acid hydrolase [Syntrophaceae bacterium]